jgi:hypothetical protein
MMYVLKNYCERNSFLEGSTALAWMGVGAKASMLLPQTPSAFHSVGTSLKGGLSYWFCKTISFNPLISLIQ